MRSIYVIKLERPILVHSLSQTEEDGFFFYFLRSISMSQICNFIDCSSITVFSKQCMKQTEDVTSLVMVSDIAPGSVKPNFY